MASQHYRFRINGRLSAELVTSFAPVAHTIGDGHTTFICQVADDAELFGIISRCETLGLHLVGLARCTDPGSQQVAG